MHEMTVDHAHEEIQLLANDISGMLFETTYYVPSFAAHYKSARPGAVVRLSEAHPAGDAVAARRNALGAEVAAAPGAVPGPASPPSPTPPSL